MIRHIGIVAVSAEGAALCYRTICTEAPAILGRHAHPEITMHTFPLSAYMRPIYNGDWLAVGDRLLASADKLRVAGAQLVICPDNTVHEGLDLVRDRSPLPWLHIAEEVADVAATQEYERLLVLGTRYLMEGPVYATKLSAKGLDFEIPDAAARERINRFTFDELVYGRFEEPARSYFREVIRAAQRRGCDAVVLGCTEFPLLIGDADSPLPVLDSTRILARAALREATRDPL